MLDHLTDDQQATLVGDPTPGEANDPVVILLNTLIDRANEVEDAREGEASLTARMTAFLLVSAVGQANGVAPLDASAMLLESMIPASIARDSEITAAVDAAVTALVDGAPGTLDTLAEIAAALQDNPDVITELTSLVGTKVAASLYDANTILKADADNTPTPLTVAEATLVGRLTGGVIASLTVSQIKTLLAITVNDVGGLTAALDAKQPKTLVGNLSARPTAASAGNGAEYFAVDARQTFQSNGNPGGWREMGASALGVTRMLGHTVGAASDTTINTATTAAIAGGGLTVAGTTIGNPIRVEFDATILNGLRTQSLHLLSVVLFQDSAEIASQLVDPAGWDIVVAGSSPVTGVTLTRQGQYFHWTWVSKSDLIPAAGAHTWEIRIRQNVAKTTGSPDFEVDSIVRGAFGNPPSLTVYELGV